MWVFITVDLCYHLQHIRWSARRPGPVLLTSSTESAQWAAWHPLPTTCLDSGQVSKYAGEDLSTILRVEPDEETVEGDDNTGEGEELEENTSKRRSHCRFTEAQTQTLKCLLRARERVPRTSELREWLSRLEFV